MSLLFNRKYRLTIGPPTGGVSVEFSELQMTFRADLNDEIHANNCEVVIVNVSEDTIENFIVEDNIATLYAGYGDDLNLLFKGAIDTVSTQYDNGDITVELNFRDAQVELVQTNVDKFWPAGTTLDVVLRSLTTQDMGLAYASNNGNYPPNTGINYRFARGVSVTGNAKVWIDKAVKAHDLKYFIQNGTAYVIPVSQPTGAEVAQVFSADSGLIGSPYKKKVSEKSNKRKKSKTQYSGVEFRALLSPALRIGSLVKLESRTVKGIYQLTKVRHTGDYRGGSWFTDCEGILPITASET